MVSKLPVECWINGPFEGDMVSLGNKYYISQY